MLRRIIAVTLALSACTSAYAGEFPSRTVTIVSPYQAGGTSDIIARILAQKLSEQWGKSVIVENRPGANGGIGVTAVTHATPDGHTLLAVASSALTINPLFYPKLPYNVDLDLAAISRTGTVANVLVANPSVPATSVQALIALAKARPGQLSYASQGNGSNGQVTGELFKQRANIDILHIPYKGSAPAVQDLLAGQVQLMFDNLPSVLPLIRSGQLRALAVTTAERSPALPDTPTPEAVRTEIERAAIAALTAPDTRERLRAAGIDVTADGSIALQKRIGDETQMWRGVISKAGINVE